MTKKGFTLVELLGVIIIVFILSGLAVFGYIGIKDHVNKTYYLGLEESLLMAANDYYAYNQNLIPKNSYEIKKVYINELISKKFVDKVVDQDGNACSEDSYVMAYKDTKNKIKYSVCLKCGNEYDSTETKECEETLESSVPTKVTLKNTNEYYKDSQYVNSNVIIEARATEKVEQIYISKINEDSTEEVIDSCSIIDDNEIKNCSNNKLTAEILESGQYKSYGKSNETIIEGLEINIKIDKEKPYFNIKQGENILTKNEVFVNDMSDSDIKFVNIMDNLSGIKRIRYSLELKDRKEIYKEIDKSQNSFLIPKPTDTETYKLVIEVSDNAGNITKEEINYYYQNDKEININIDINNQEEAKLLCNDLTYNGQPQKLINDIEGITFIDNEQTSTGLYTVTAKLKDGYIWKDKTKDDKKIKCVIK